jgi:hypothetical protein
MSVKIRLFDSSFDGSHSASINGDNAGTMPTYFVWARDGKMTDPTFFTDSQLREVANAYPRYIKRVAWLLEPECLREDHYALAWHLQDLFDVIFTYDKRLLQYENVRFYPYGGSWIDFNEWKRHDKSFLVSIIASGKRSTDGHKLRHDVIGNYRDYLDAIYGRGYIPLDRKIFGLSSFRYSVVIESCKLDYYFTEKLIDCLSVGTVPLYWGCPSITDYFDPDGLIVFDSLDDLEDIFKMVSEKDYEQRIPAIEKNIELAKQYRICEDWMYLNHREVFE